MQVPILSGIYTDANNDFRSAYPLNLMPVPKNSGISKGYLRPADGIVQFASGPGSDRGGINWNGVCYRVMGSKLVMVAADGTVTVLADVGFGFDTVTFGYSFDRLAVCSNGKFFYWNGTSIQQVVDPNLGVVIQFIWIDGYFMTTDGTSIVVTELNNPAAVFPLEYGSSEADPDAIVGIAKLLNQPYVINRYTIEVFYNAGGSLFPFQRVTGGEIQRGAVGSHAFCTFNSALGSAFIAMIGSGLNEPCSVFKALNGVTVKIATREIDTILQNYTEAQLANCVVETRIDKAHELLYIHLPDRTLVYDEGASKGAGEYVWFILSSAEIGFSTYRARNLVWCYGKWIVGDVTTSLIGYLTNTLSSHYGSVVKWEFMTSIIYNNTNGLEFHELELVCLTGNVNAAKDPVVYTSYSTDGRTWSNERPRRAGKLGQRSQRLNWLQMGNMLNWRIQKFRGDSDAYISPICLECRVEALNV